MQVNLKNHNKGIIEYEVTFANSRFSLLNLGASIYKIEIKDNNKWENIVVSYDKPEDYLDNHMFLGTTVGSFGGRIKNAKYTYKDQEFHLPKNLGNHSIHGGPNGLHTKIFEGKVVELNENKVVITFTSSLTIKDDGLPGQLDVEITYTLFDRKIDINLKAKSTAPRICNLTNHTYWNLSGDIRETIHNMSISRSANQHYEIDNEELPTKLVESKGIFDFRKIKKFDEILKDTNGFDHPFLIEADGLILKQENKKREIKLTSSQKCAVLYTHNFSLEKKLGKWEKGSKNLGIAIEFQKVPNDTKSTILEKGQTYNEFIKVEF